MKKLLLLLAAVLMVGTVTAQKVKIKDKIAYVNDEAYLTWDNNDYMIRLPGEFKHISGESTILVMQIHQYGQKVYNNVRFTDFDSEFWTIMPRKKIIKSLYNAGVINADGTVDEEKARRFIRTYHQEPPRALIIGY